MTCKTCKTWWIWLYHPTALGRVIHLVTPTGVSTDPRSAKTFSSELEAIAFLKDLPSGHALISGYRAYRTLILPVTDDNRFT